MPEKTTKSGRKYAHDGKVFTWPAEEGGEVKIPMRLKLKVLRKMTGRDLDVDAMFELIEAVAPDQADVIDEMDVNEFQDMFATWQEEYNALTGASLGESSGSSA